MYKSLIIMLLLSVSSNCFGGIETELLVKRYADCQVRVVFDAALKSKTGVIIYRSFVIVDGIHEPCPLKKELVGDSLSKAFGIYLSKNDLKPVNSVLIGRLIKYPWVKKIFEKNKSRSRKKKFSNTEMYNLVNKSEILKPFKVAIRSHGYVIKNIICEKILFYKNGAPMDALCWIVIEKDLK